MGSKRKDRDKENVSGSESARSHEEDKRTLTLGARRSPPMHAFPNACGIRTALNTIHALRPRFPLLPI